METERDSVNASSNHIKQSAEQNSIIQRETIVFCFCWIRWSPASELDQRIVHNDQQYLCPLVATGISSIGKILFERWEIVSTDKKVIKGIPVYVPEANMDIMSTLAEQ